MAGPQQAHQDRPVGREEVRPAGSRLPDGTTRHQATRAETAKAARTQQPGPSRTILAEHIEAVAAAVVDEESFFAGLADRGLLIRYRRSPDRHRRITGYAVGLPGDLRRDGSQAWFSGSTLAPYLSLLKLRRRWDGGSPLAGHYMQAPAAKAVLRREVTAAAAASTTEDGFLAALKARNLDTEIRYAPDRPGTRTGYTVGMPGLTRRDGTPRRYAGGTLDPNLTLGQLRARWRAGLPGAAPPGLYDGADAAALVYFCAADETRPPGELDEAIRSLRERADRLVYLAKGYRSASARAAELAENAPVTL
jgi:hypothetical protein